LCVFGAGVCFFGCVWGVGGGGVYGCVVCVCVCGKGVYILVP